MKFKSFFNVVTVCALSMFVSTTARAVQCEESPSGPYPYANELANHNYCNTGTTETSRYYQLQNGDYIKATSCTSCTSGATLTLVKYQINPYDGGVCEIWYEECQCPDCTNCTSTDWSDYSTSHQSRTVKTCDCGTCNSTTEYRCRDDYYGSPTGPSSGCTKCDTLYGVQSRSTAGNNSYHSKCCFTSDVSIPDTVGSFHFTNGCCWEPDGFEPIG